VTIFLEKELNRGNVLIIEQRTDSTSIIEDKVKCKRILSNKKIELWFNTESVDKIEYGYNCKHLQEARPDIDKT
jgi:hypothetical protein